MIEKSFTPAPWTSLHYRPDYEFSSVLAPGGTPVAYAWREEDARLIAAAPELYAALDALTLDRIEERHATPALVAAVAALAKARGE